MGLDIYPVVEYKVRGRWTWEPIPSEHPLRALRRRLIPIVCSVEWAGRCGPADSFRGLPRGWSGPRDREELIGVFGGGGLSWVLLREIEEFPWDGGESVTAWVRLEAWRSWDGKSSLRGWTVSDPAPIYLKFEPDDWRRLENEGVAPAAEDRVLIRATFIDRMRETAPEFFDVVLPWLRSLGGPDDVRLVYRIGE